MTWFMPLCVQSALANPNLVHPETIADSMDQFQPLQFVLCFPKFPSRTLKFLRGDLAHDPTEFGAIQ